MTWAVNGNQREEAEEAEEGSGGTRWVGREVDKYGAAERIGTRVSVGGGGRGGWKGGNVRWVLSSGRFVVGVVGVG